MSRGKFESLAAFRLPLTGSASSSRKAWAATYTNIGSPRQSKDWLSFPSRVYADRQSQASGLVALPKAIGSAASPADIQKAVQAYNAAQRRWDPEIPVVGSGPYALVTPMDLPPMKIHGRNTPGTNGLLGSLTSQVNDRITKMLDWFQNGPAMIQNLIKQKTAELQAQQAAQPPMNLGQAPSGSLTPGVNTALTERTARKLSSRMRQSAAEICESPS